MLETIAAEMKAKAVASKLDIAQGKVPAYEDTTKTIAVGDQMVKVMFTCDVFPGNKEIWHLSMSVIPYAPVPTEVAERVRKAFFGESETFEMPSFLHGDRMKQFVARV
jgi:hypothetical protein